ncbi:MAG: hypothetical protein R3338_15070 [Thermoanaerobaculia bacterium]|nr:hypothetical protein [Thermoanaerobaculia bacterium]
MLLRSSSEARALIVDPSARRAYPPPMSRHFWIGLALVAVAWPLNWTLDDLRTHLLFFPLWLGYVLVVDGIVLRRTGSSMLRRSRTGFVLMFVFSAAVWWLFELINLRIRNWRYDGREYFTDLEYALLASLSFSIVIPAVFETADLWRSFKWSRTWEKHRPVLVSRRMLIGWFFGGLAMIVLVVAFPRFTYPLTWIALLFLVEPVAYRLRRASLLHHLERGDWTPWIVLPLGAITCGFFWEMWNFWSYPKWIYDVPGFNFWHVFEMPFFGYFGYLPFGLELYPLIHLLLGPKAQRTLGWS